MKTRNSYTRLATWVAVAGAVSSASRAATGPSEVDHSERTLLVTRLSRAEREILPQVLAGASNAEIATSRSRSERTIDNQIRSILQKMQVSSRRELLASGLASFRHQGMHQDLSLLSQRERQAVSLASRGLSDKAIASELGLAIGTIAALLARARAKLGLYSP